MHYMDLLGVCARKYPEPYPLLRDSIMIGTNLVVLIFKNGLIVEWINSVIKLFI